jgi:hypothetical protein
MPISELSLKKIENQTNRVAVSILFPYSMTIDGFYKEPHEN